VRETSTSPVPAIAEHAVARRLHEAAAVRLHVAAHDRVVLVEERPPAAVAECRGPLGRAHDVGEAHGGEHAFGRDGVALAGDERLDLAADQVEVERRVPARDLHELRVGDVVGEPAMSTSPAFA